MIRVNTNIYRMVALMVVLLAVAVVTNGCHIIGVDHSPELRIPGIPTQVLKGTIIHSSSGTEYIVVTETMLAFGGAPFQKYVWTNHANMPAGTTFDVFTGIFHGLGTGSKLLPGTRTFEMEVTDGHKTAKGTFTFMVTEYYNMGPMASFEQPSIPSIVLPDAYTGYGYGASLWALGNAPTPWSWSLESGELPPGLIIDPSSGIVRGEVASDAAGKTYDFTITVRCAGGTPAIVMVRPTYTISVPH